VESGILYISYTSKKLPIILLLSRKRKIQEKAALDQRGDTFDREPPVHEGPESPYLREKKKDIRWVKKKNDHSIRGVLSATIGFTVYWGGGLAFRNRTWGILLW